MNEVILDCSCFVSFLKENIVFILGDGEDNRLGMRGGY